MAKNKGKQFVGPKSLCQCGHTGDGENSDHANEQVSGGSGACLVPGCVCGRFTWKQFTKKYETFLERSKS